MKRRGREISYFYCQQVKDLCVLQIINFVIHRLTLSVARTNL